MAPKKVVKSPAIKIQFMNLTLVGDSPLVCHAWSEKAKKIMADDQDPRKGQASKNKKRQNSRISGEHVSSSERKTWFPVNCF